MLIWLVFLKLKALLLLIQSYKKFQLNEFKKYICDLTIKYYVYFNHVELLMLKVYMTI